MDFPGRPVVQALVRTFVAVEREVSCESSLTIGSRFVLLEVDVFVLDASPESLDKHVVQGAAATIHADVDRL